MSKKISDSVYDAGLNYILGGTGIQQVLLAAPPLDRTEAIANALCLCSMSGADMSIGDGVSGRALTFKALEGNTVIAEGVHNYTAVISDTELLAVTTGSGKTLNPGDTVNTSSFTLQLNDPV